MAAEMRAGLHELAATADTVQEFAAGRESLLRRLLRDRLAIAGLVLVSLFALAAIFAPVLAPHDPLAIDPTHRLPARPACIPSAPTGSGGTR